MIKTLRESDTPPEKGSLPTPERPMAVGYVALARPRPWQKIERRTPAACAMLT